MTANMTLEQMQAQIQALMARNAELEAALPKPKMAIKVSAKGAISVYGLGRFPVTLYMSQWQALFERREDIEKFIVDNLAALAKKEDANA